MQDLLVTSGYQYLRTSSVTRTSSGNPNLLTSYPKHQNYPGLSIDHIRAFFCTSKWFLQLQDIHVRSGSQYLRTSSSHHNLIRTPVPLELVPKPLGLLQNSRSATLGLSLVPLNGPCNCRTFSWYQDLNTSEHHHDIVTSPGHHILPKTWWLLQVSRSTTLGLSLVPLNGHYGFTKTT